jgi:hypothetical protein
MPVVEAESMTFVHCNGVVWAAHMWCSLRDGLRPAKAAAVIALYRREPLEPPGRWRSGPLAG